MPPFIWILSVSVCSLFVIPDRLDEDEMRSLCGALAVVRQKSHWIIIVNVKMNVWKCKCKLIFPTDTLQQNIEITDLKPFLDGENTSVLIILATTVYTHTHAHTHTHVGFYGLRGLSIGVMVFILYKLYVLLPYTYPTPKLSPHRCISTFPPKNLLCMIYTHFELWGH